MLIFVKTLIENVREKNIKLVSKDIFDETIVGILETITEKGKRVNQLFAGAVKLSNEDYDYDIF